MIKKRQMAGKWKAGSRKTEMAWDISMKYEIRNTATLVASAPSLVKATRPKPDDMAAIVEDLIKLLDSAGNQLRRHHYPSPAESKKLATLMRAVADNFDVQE